MNKTLGFSSLIILIVFIGIGIYYSIGGKELDLVVKVFSSFYVVLQLLGIAFLLLTNNIIENHKRKLVRIGDFVLVIGIAALFFHISITWAYLVISLGLVLIFIDLIVRIKLNQNKRQIEVLKIIWYFFFWTSIVFKGLHLAGSQVLLFISIVVLWSALTLYLFKNGMPKYIK